MDCFVKSAICLSAITFVSQPASLSAVHHIHYFTDASDILNPIASQVANEVIGEMNLKPEEVFLAQGTLRPDLIESASHMASGKAAVIKTHHNDTELIRELRKTVRHTCLFY